MLYRSDQWRSKIIAANVTQIAIVVAPVPSYLDELIGRALIAAEAEDIEPLIVLNKCDLPQAAAAREALRYYEALGYPLLALSAKADVAPLRERLQGHISVLVGQSGMGKSTLLNALVPEANARVNDISEALDSGKHTTTHATFYHLDDQVAGTALIDSPGLQSFGLAHVKEEQLPGLMPDFRPLQGQCRFHNCRHRQEPSCALKLRSRRARCLRRGCNCCIACKTNWPRSILIKRRRTIACHCTILVLNTLRTVARRAP